MNATLEQSTKILAVFSGTPFAQMQAIIESGALADIRDGDYTVFDRDLHRTSLGVRLISYESVVILAAISEFNAEEHFKQDWIFYGGGFKKHFLKKRESHYMDNRQVAYGILTRNSTYSTILEILGAKAEVSLADVYSLMYKQSKGEEGALLINGSCNWFFSKSIDGKLLPIQVSFAHWDGGTEYWYIDAHEQQQVFKCAKGSRVFCGADHI